VLWLPYDGVGLYVGCLMMCLACFWCRWSVVDLCLGWLLLLVGDLLVVFVGVGGLWVVYGGIGLYLWFVFIWVGLCWG